jgi:hypothetical protein
MTVILNLFAYETNVIQLNMYLCRLACVCVFVPDVFSLDDLNKPCFGITCGPNGYCDHPICSCYDGSFGIRCEYKGEKRVAASRKKKLGYAGLHHRRYSVHNPLFVLVCMLSLFI